MTAKRIRSCLGLKMKLNKIIGLRGVGCCGNSEEEEDLWLGRGDICSNGHPDTGAVLLGMREGIPNRIHTIQAGRPGW